MGIALSGQFLANGFKNFKSSGGNSVSVKGMAQKIVPADTFSLTISFWEEDEDVLSSNQKIKNSQKQIKDLLMDLGFTEFEISIQPYQISEKVKKIKKDADGEERKTYLRIDGAIDVKTNRIDLGEGISEKIMVLADYGIKYKMDVRYILSDLDSVRPQMLSDALVSAKNAANEFAKTSGSELGKIKSADQGRFTVTSPAASDGYDHTEALSKMKKVRVVSRVTFSLNG